jgi:hypothetical protein
MPLFLVLFLIFQGFILADVRVIADDNYIEFLKVVLQKLARGKVDNVLEC